MTGILQSLLGSVSSAAASATDAFFNLVTLLLPGNGTNGAQNNTFLDSSTNNFTITRNGNTTQGTFSPFSQTGWSNYLASSGRLAFGINSAFDITQGDFTVEAWVNISSYSAAQHIAWYRNDSPQSGWGFRISITTGYLQIFYTGGSIVTSTSAVPLNSWVHVAACRSGGTCYLFINGTQVGSAAFSNGTTQTSFGFRIGADGAGTENLIGYISNFRLVKSGALYTSSFTPSTTPLTTTVSAGTVSLLTCQSNRFVDNSSNAFAITLEGTTTSVQPFSPFAPTAAYDAATNGGSTYIDGTGDWLTITETSSQFTFGTGDYEYSFWVYPSDTSTAQRTLFGRTTNGNTAFPYIYLVATTRVVSVYYSATIVSGTSAIRPFEWTYIVVSRVSGTTRIFVNGVQEGSASDTTSLISPTSVIVGNNGTTANLGFPGYISGARIRKGSGSTSVTVPTAPPTAITNTQLLLNFTNAGITDATAKNVLETVGNAQISTTQSKFGGSSMYFDGTGDRLYFADGKAYVNGTEPFTLECWVYLGGTPNYWTIFGSSSSNGLLFTVQSLTDVIVNPSGLGNTVSGTTSLTAGTWFHLALTRNSANRFDIWVNGASIGNATSTQSFGTPTMFVIGAADNSGGQQFNGYLDDVRISKFCRYTTTFTPPTAAFPLS